MHIKKYYNLGKNILFPICRSITGQGIKKTLNIIKNEFPKLKIHNVNSGEKVFDWKIPPEWNIKDAYILDQKNNKKNNLHLISYSIPVNKNLKKREILSRLFVNKESPNSIPYITSYYKKYWGFCCTYYQKKNIQKNYDSGSKFKVVIK